MRICRDCKLEKGNAEFYNKGNNVVDCCCKPCRILIITNRLKSNPVAHRRATLSGRAWYRNNLEHNKKKHHERYRRVGVSGDPLKIAAREALHLAILKGEVIKPTVCPECSREFPKRLIHGHHDDYLKPLVVKWKCAECHGKEHRKYDY